jgi:hypothetical protein
MKIIPIKDRLFNTWDKITQPDSSIKIKWYTIWIALSIPDQFRFKDVIRPRVRRDNAKN